MEKNNFTNSNNIVKGSPSLNVVVEDKKFNQVELNKNYNQSLNSRSNLFRSIENVGYKSANKIHRFATLGLFLFTFGNIGILLYKYNTYWKGRRVSHYLISNFTIGSCIRLQIGL